MADPVEHAIQLVPDLGNIPAGTEQEQLAWLAGARARMERRRKNPFTVGTRLHGYWLDGYRRYQARVDALDD